MYIDLTLHCLSQLTHIKHRDEAVFKQTLQQLVCFQRNPTDTSLQLHLLKGNVQEQLWSLLIAQSLRAVFYYRQFDGEKRAVFISLTF